MKVKLNTLLDSLQGKLETNEDGSKIVFRKYKGHQEAYVQKKTTTERSDRQKATNARFTLIHQQASAEYNNPTLRQQWQTEYNQNKGIYDGKKYSNLYNYIVGKKHKTTH